MDVFYKIFGIYVIISIFTSVICLVRSWYKAEDREITYQNAARITLLWPFWFLLSPIASFVCGAKWLISMAIWGKK